MMKIFVFTFMILVIFGCLPNTEGSVIEFLTKTHISNFESIEFQCEGPFDACGGIIKVTSSEELEKIVDNTKKYCSCKSDDYYDYICFKQAKSDTLVVHGLIQIYQDTIWFETYPNVF